MIIEIFDDLSQNLPNLPTAGRNGMVHSSLITGNYDIYARSTRWLIYEETVS
jgi:hypothetical protein